MMRKPFHISASVIIKFYLAIATLAGIFCFDDFYNDPDVTRRKVKFRLTTLLTFSIALLLSYITIKILRFFNKMPGPTFSLADTITEIKSMPRIHFISFVLLSTLVVLFFAIDLAYEILYIFYEDYLSNHSSLLPMAWIPTAIALFAILFLVPVLRYFIKREPKNLDLQSENKRDSSLKNGSQQKP